MLDGGDRACTFAQYFVRISLVADVPDNPVMWGVIKIVKSNSEFDATKARPLGRFRIEKYAHYCPRHNEQANQNSKEIQLWEKI